ncbi:pentatricopeptide repeat-containing protein At5g66520-like [Neltuma alba]|uniref:pentatricopeptide repeat-containing protein At5g66520-like n=1 Tax=Neltuma alba TaxID=207710 RepID=UPI0010A552EC|nr:pentatricopeptide repeat-containing protein At5g66520-like [Prosopis alba]
MSLSVKFLLQRHPKKAIEQRVGALLQNINLSNLLQLHALFIKTCFFCHNNFLKSKFLNAVISLSLPHDADLYYARSIFDSFSLPDTFIWNTMMRAYLNAQKPAESLALYFQMRFHDDLSLDSFSLSLVLQACGRLMDCDNGVMIHSHGVKLGFCHDLYVQTALIEMYAKCGFTECAAKILDFMEEPDLVSYNVLLSEYVKLGEIQKAHELFDRMPRRDLVSWNTIIHGCASLGDAWASEKLFDIASSEQRQQSNQALKLFHDMQLANVAPDKITLISVLNACGNVGALGMGKMIHEYIERNRIGIDMKLGTSLLDMYAKCGDIDSSVRIFEGLKEKDIFTWSVMIMGFSNHGLGHLALEYFTKMLAEEIEPNDVTFIGVLSACSHIGLVETGWMYFKSMTSVYRIDPKIEHYGCMVDILGRAGRLQEAMEIIKTMPLSPDAIVWRAFLGACKIHKNVELAEEATANLLELEPHVDGNYVLLSNIYSQAMKWDKVTNLRKMMKNANVQKIPGTSSIEVDNAVHEFVSGDKSHPKSFQIYEMLDEILHRLQSAGYEPLTASSTQYLEEQEKQNLLASHSEKLAIAFGILTTAPGTTIRIFKNLRVCEDCHFTIKFIAKVYQRKIIVRDRNRFHDFEEGSCSCKDFW